MSKRVIVVLAAMLGAGCARMNGATEVTRLLSKEKRTPIDDVRDCLTCHTKIRAFYAGSAHRSALGCENCHGPGGGHAEDPPKQIVTAGELRGLSPAGNSELCLRCHSAFAASWSRSEHGRADLACFACHTDVVHFRQDKAVEPPSGFVNSARFCEQCHATAAAEFRQPYRHPVFEGEVRCVDCHAIHGEARRVLDEPDRERCGRCHARQAMPRVFRHAALDEGCQVCHAPHGSPLASLLARDGNNLCLQCHLEPSFPRIAGVDHGLLLAKGARCYDCHVEVHGSNTDPTLLGRIR